MLILKNWNLKTEHTWAIFSSRLKWIFQCLDDRTDPEKNKNHPCRVSPVLVYLGDKHKSLNDVKFSRNRKFERQMIKAGMSKSLARHFAFVLNHNPAVLYAESIKGKESNFYIVEFILFIAYMVHSSKWPDISIDKSSRLNLTIFYTKTIEIIKYLIINWSETCPYRFHWSWLGSSPINILINKKAPRSRKLSNLTEITLRDSRTL